MNAPAAAAFTIWFENCEAVPHNVNVLDAAGASMAKSEIFSGPAARALEVPALAPGNYRLTLRRPSGHDRAAHRGVAKVALDRDCRQFLDRLNEVRAPHRTRPEDNGHEKADHQPDFQPRQALDHRTQSCAGHGARAWEGDASQISSAFLAEAAARSDARPRMCRARAVGRSAAGSREGARPRPAHHRPGSAGRQCRWSAARWRNVRAGPPRSRPRLSLQGQCNRPQYHYHW